MSEIKTENVWAKFEHFQKKRCRSSQQLFGVGGKSNLDFKPTCPCERKYICNNVLWKSGGGFAFVEYCDK